MPIRIANTLRNFDNDKKTIIKALEVVLKGD